MPTANANTGNSFRSTLSYVYQEGKKLEHNQQHVIVEQQNVFGDSTAGQGRVMRAFAVERPSIKKPVMHLQINFHPDEQVDNAIAQKAIHSILADIGVSVDNSQYVIVQHRDKPHNHYHIVLNRVCLDQSIIETHRIKDRLQVACDKVEQMMNLRATRGRTVVYAPDSEKGYVYTNRKEQKLKKTISDKNTAIKEVKKSLQQALNQVLGLVEVVDAGSLKKSLEDRKIDVVYRENKNGITGLSFRYANIACSGNDIGFSWPIIQKELNNKVNAGLSVVVPVVSAVEDSPVEEKLNFVSPLVGRGEEVSSVVRAKDIPVASKFMLEQRLTDVLKSALVHDPYSLKQVLSDYQIAVTYRENSKGITGISFRYGDTVYKGHDIGFSWPVIQDCLNQKSPSAVSVVTSYILHHIETEKIRNVPGLVDFLSKHGHLLDSSLSSDMNSLESAQIRVSDAICQGGQLDIKRIYDALDEVKFDIERSYRHRSLIGLMPLDQAIDKLKESIVDQLYESLKKGVDIIALGVDDVMFTMYVDQAIREVMRRIDPLANPWSTWEYLNYPTNLESSYKDIYASIPGLVEQVEERFQLDSLLYSKNFVEEIIQSTRGKIEQEIYAERYSLDIDQMVCKEIMTKLQGIDLSKVSVEKYMSDYEFIADEISGMKSELDILIRNPLPKELLEARLVKVYNTKIHGFIEEINQHIKEGAYKIDYGALLLKHGFSTQDNKIILRLDGASIERSIEPLNEFVYVINESLKEYYANLQLYNQAINPVFHKIHPIYSFTKSAKIKKAENDRLLDLKEAAQKPKLNIDITVLNKLTVTAKGNYEKRKAGILLYERSLKPTAITKVENTQKDKSIKYKP
ncbi:relaxase/mobilization nuclease domain-containing protein [Sphingobacterium rhinopitheci]|uniref:relaxase/mobilization nuclease domain-containing protein n=1 Tax=Sphingobacterium rhinopitheci TaxID=2781960 RepID=UPI001F522EC1|nr:relaxase/mobilization nuclease domain-containing protein [Sphingobacterium rhinopitheci]MCI0922739.1 relaxase/mobilization nuclease domain-containing protein [Sphingobacterium rhinopitheci]